MKVVAVLLLLLAVVGGIAWRIGWLRLQARRHAEMREMFSRCRVMPSDGSIPVMLGYLAARVRYAVRP